MSHKDFADTFVQFARGEIDKSEMDAAVERLSQDIVESYEQNGEFNVLRLRLTNALGNVSDAKHLVSSIRSNPESFTRFSYREQTILAGIYGDLCSYLAHPASSAEDD
jgi:hypothetical protein